MVVEVELVEAVEVMVVTVDPPDMPGPPAVDDGPADWGIVVVVGAATVITELDDLADSPAKSVTDSCTL